MERPLSAPRPRPRWMLPLALILVVGTAAAAGVVLSNILEYPGQVANQMIVTAPWLGTNGTSLTWYVGIYKNVSISVAENGYVGNAHAVYEVHATGIGCSDVNLSGFYGDSATCTAGTDVVTFDANSKTLDGSGSVSWWFHMTMNSIFPSVTLRIYVVQY